MRLGQFARKYDIRVQDIISYLEKTEEEIHSNTKLSDEDESEILDFFGIEAQEEIEVIEPPVAAIDPPKIIDQPVAVEVENEEKVKEAVELKEEIEIEDEDAWIEQDEPVIVKAVNTEKPKEEKELAAPKPAPRIAETPEEDIALAEGELDFMPAYKEEKEADLEGEEEVQEQPAIQEQLNKAAALLEPEKKPEPKEDEVIDTERLMELLESEEEAPDLDKIKLIKAAKKELSGLKVIGKVDLPEPKKKEVSEEEASEKEVSSSRRNDRPKISDEEREKRRLKAKQKKEEFAAREKRRAKEKEEKERRDRNASHYKQKLSQPKPKKQKQKPKKTVTVAATPSVVVPTATSALPKKAKVKKEQPTSALGKMWKWITNPD